ncbi:hypothetical protein [Vibrio aquimaris]|uniref:hypothetical protein n=1 Tax=Vibrio aquimaris TaxID=2587862 RepID=UPI0012695675|nr:hypothetical protein [Vibrio aquimaris]
MSDRALEQAVNTALSKTQRFLERESFKRLGLRLQIKRKGIKDRIRKSKVKGNHASVWFGLMDMPVDRLRDWHQNSQGVVSGGEVHRGAFAQTVNTAFLAWSRWRERPKASTRKKRSPNGQRVKERDRRHKSKIERLTTNIEFIYSDVIQDLESESAAFFQETLADEISQAHG